jgi:hypothetical protein
MTAEEAFDKLHEVKVCNPDGFNKKTGALLCKSRRSFRVSDSNTL